MEAVLDTSQWDLFLTSLSKRFEKASEYLKVAVSTKGRADVLDHFANQSGPSGRWPPRSPKTQADYARRGKTNAKYNPSNLLLQLTGRLRGSILPAGREGGVKVINKNAVMLFSAVEYSRAHDEGIPGRLPQRQFMWLSSKGNEEVANVFLGAIMDGL